MHSKDDAIGTHQYDYRKQNCQEITDPVFHFCEQRYGNECDSEMRDVR